MTKRKQEPLRLALLKAVVDVGFVRGDHEAAEVLEKERVRLDALGKLRREAKGETRAYLRARLPLAVEELRQAVHDGKLVTPASEEIAQKLQLEGVRVVARTLRNRLKNPLR